MRAPADHFLPGKMERAGHGGASGVNDLGMAVVSPASTTEVTRWVT